MNAPQVHAIRLRKSAEHCASSWRFEPASTSRRTASTGANWAPPIAKKSRIFRALRDQMWKSASESFSRAQPLELARVFEHDLLLFRREARTVEPQMP
jgi:hypothetical protein